MYNCFKAEQLRATSRELHNSDKKQQRYHRRYKTQIQPKLVDKYNRRINGFAKKMEDQPKLIQEADQPIPQYKLFRNPDHKLNISQAQFRFRTSQDWKSLFTSSERLDRAKQLKDTQRRNDNSNMALRSIGSQSPYSNKVQEFRVRDRKKDINPPMKYTNKNSLMALASLPQFKKRHMKILKNNKSIKDNSNTQISRTSFESEAKESDIGIGNVSETDILSLYNYMINKKTERSKTEKEIQEEEQLKALAQNKLYFKSLIDLEQNVKTKKEKYILKDTLIKCGVVRKPKLMGAEEDELDQFQELMRSGSKYQDSTPN